MAAVGARLFHTERTPEGGEGSEDYISFRQLMESLQLQRMLGDCPAANALEAQQLCVRILAKLLASERFFATLSNIGIVPFILIRARANSEEDLEDLCIHREEFIAQLKIPTPDIDKRLPTVSNEAFESFRPSLTLLSHAVTTLDRVPTSQLSDMHVERIFLPFPLLWSRALLAQLAPEVFPEQSELRAPPKSPIKPFYRKKNGRKGSAAKAQPPQVNP